MCCIKQQKEVYKMKMIAFYNNKGGVGKTSTAINIAYTLSRRENRVLLIDFDGQCNSSRFFTDLTNDEIGCERAIVCTDEKPLIKKTRYDNIDIVTSSVMEQIINRAVSRKVHGNPCCLHCCVYFLSVHERHTENIQTTGYPIGLQLIRI